MCTKKRTFFIDNSSRDKLNPIRYHDIMVEKDLGFSMITARKYLYLLAANVFLRKEKLALQTFKNCNLSSAAHGR
jgi:hypothetical protein